MSVRRCQQEIDSAEFTEWQAYWQLEPFGSSWTQTAQLCLAVAISGWAKKQGDAPWELDDWMPPGACSTRPEQTPEEVWDRIMARVAGLGG